MLDASQRGGGRKFRLGLFSFIIEIRCFLVYSKGFGLSLIFRSKWGRKFSDMSRRGRKISDESSGEGAKILYHRYFLNPWVK